MEFLVQLLLLVSTFMVLLLFSKTTIAGDTITHNKPLAHNQTLVSLGQTFELGFFTLPEGSSNSYLGIWYKNISTLTVVWVANRDNPVLNSYGVLSISENGSLVLRNGTGLVAWLSSNYSSVRSPIAKLLDSGNLVLKHEGQDDPESYIWQSFDFPTDTLLEGMKLGWDLKSGFDRKLTSWKSLQDPSPGEYTNSMDRRGFPQPSVFRGSVKTFRNAVWNGLSFTGAITPIIVYNNREVYYAFKQGAAYPISRLVLSPSGLLQRLVWNQQSWIVLYTFQQDQCDRYGLCGAYGTCNINNGAGVCQCLKGFKSKTSQTWDPVKTADGCTRRVGLGCSKGEGFMKYSSVKMPDTSECLVHTNKTAEECRIRCLKNCSCTAYTSFYLVGTGNGCLMWSGDLIDIRESNERGQDLYVKLAAAELASASDRKTEASASDRKTGHKRKKSINVIVLISPVVGMLLLGSIIFWFIWKARTKRRGEEKSNRDDLDLPLYDFSAIAAATDNFSSANKLGQGGFGPVYKGILLTGQEIAAKRLSQDSGQGLDEFKNEVILIAKLQHRNLVRLLGCCIQKEERVLIYEYLSNKSLDYFLFDETRTMLLDWEKRFHIVVGIAQGLLYLHRDSRLRIIHRDLKAGNILLDNEMNPKISDFGMARTFGGDQTEAETRKVVGTYGYMSPEYAIEGRFSMKSDVYSFGVLVLEIVIGKKNRGFYHHSHDLNLLGHAWRMWNESKALELVDISIEGKQSASEALKVIHVGLLCVQQSPVDRPNMPSVVLMLSSENPSLPPPKQPGFYNERCLLEADSSSSGKKFSTSNEVTVTLLEGR